MWSQAKSPNPCGGSSLENGASFEHMVKTLPLDRLNLTHVESGTTEECNFRYIERGL